MRRNYAGIDADGIEPAEQACILYLHAAIHDHLETGIALSLGANIGTCITAVLASINTSREAKRVAMAHTLFKVLGAALLVLWIPQFAQGELRFDLELPEGTPIEHTDQLVQRLEDDLGGIDGLRSMHVNVGIDARESGTVRSKKENHAELNLALEAGLGQDGEAKTSMMWLVYYYLIITFGELCLSPMGLSLVTKLSPKRLVGLMMGGWFLSTAIGNKMSGFISGLEPSTTMFLVLAAAILGVAGFIFAMLPRLDAAIKKYGA